MSPGPAYEGGLVVRSFVLALLTSPTSTGSLAQTYWTIGLEPCCFFSAFFPLGIQARPILLPGQFITLSPSSVIGQPERTPVAIASVGVGEMNREGMVYEAISRPGGEGGNLVLAPWCFRQALGKSDRTGGTVIEDLLAVRSSEVFHATVLWITVVQCDPHGQGFIGSDTEVEAVLMRRCRCPRHRWSVFVPKSLRIERQTILEL